jgi:hypothetical protein
MKPRILKLAHDDPEAEFRFEIEWMVSMTEVQRMNLMLERSADLLKLVRHHEDPTLPRLFKRP